MAHADANPIRRYPEVRETPTDLPLSTDGRTICLTLPHACQALLFDPEAALQFATRLIAAAQDIDPDFVNRWTEARLVESIMPASPVSC